jgi:hypothetical protein
MTIARRRLGEHRPKSGTVDSERKSIAEQRFGNNVPAATDTLVNVKTLSPIEKCFRNKEYYQRYIPVTTGE